MGPCVAHQWQKVFAFLTLIFPTDKKNIEKREKFEMLSAFGENVPRSSEGSKRYVT